MSNEVTIDELRIEIKAESGTAASNIDKLAQSLDRLQAVTQRMTGGGDGLNKVAKQIEKLSAISQKIQSMRGFEKLAQVVEQLKKLDGLNSIGDISGFVRNLNKLPQAVNAIAQMPSIDATKFQQIADALKPLNDLGTNNINSFLRTLGKFPQTAQQLAGVDLTQFASQIDQISRAIEPLTRQAERGGAGLTALAQIMQSTSRQARQSSDGVGLFNQTLGQIKVKTLAAIAGLRRLFSELKKGVAASAAYVENLNLFSVTMGDSAGEALKFAEAVNDALGVDVSDWIRYQGVFQSIGKGFGIASEKADVMSKNLTQLTYDISSFYNISADMAGEKLQSALSGQVMPMRQLGFAIEETTLKQVALNHGIEASVENMTQAQKAQLRYVAIMEQAGNIGVLGDMARTIDTAANGMRVLQARLQQFARAIGNMVMPVLSAVLPYATAFVQILTEGAQAIADFFGFELPKIDFSGAAVSSGFDDITSSVDAATEANEKFKGSLSSIDQLNIIGSKDEGKGSGGNENQFDLGIKLPEYDFLQGIESQTKQIVDDVKAIMPWIEALGIGLLGFKIGKSPLFTQLSELALKATPIGKVANSVKGIVGGLAAGASSGILLHGGLKNLISGNGNVGLNIAEVVAGATIGGVALTKFYKAGNKWGAALTAGLASYGIASGILDGWAKKVGDAGKKAFENELYNNGGTKISEIASAFENWASAVTEVNKQTIEKYSQLEQYDGEMDKLRDTMNEIVGIDLDFSNITPADAEKLKDPFDMLCGYLKTDFEATVKTVADDVAQVFKDLNLSGSINAEMQASFKSMQRQFDTTITDTQKVVDEYLDKMSQGYKMTDAEMKDFTQNFNFAFDLSAQKDEALQNLERTINDIDLSKIDIENEGYALEALDKIKASSEEYIKSAKDRLQAELDNTAEMRRQLDVMKQYGKITDDDYKSQTDLLDLSENLFGLNYQSQINDVRTKLEDITGAVSRQLDTSARNVVGSGEAKAKWNERLNSFLSGDLDNLDSLVKGRLLLDSKAYDANFELSQFGTTLDASVELNNIYANESTAQTWAIMLKETQPNIDVAIGRIQDETGQLKYIVGDMPTLLDANIDAIKDQTGEWQYFVGEVQPELKAKMVELYDTTGNLDYITGKKTAEVKLIVTQEYNEANRISNILSSPIDALSAQTAGLIAGLPSNLSNNLPLSQFANSLTNEDKLRMYFGDNLRGLEHDQMEEMGGYLMEGLAKGIFDNGAMVKEAISAIAYSSIDELKAICGVASPSKVFKEIGGFLMQGLGLGIENNSGLVIGAQGSLFDSMMKQQEEFKKHCEKYDLSNFSSEDFIPDLSRSYKLPAGAAVIGGAVGAAREAYSNAAQSAVIANNGQTIDAHFTVQSYVELDGEQVGHAAAEYNQQQMAYSNGR